MAFTKEYLEELRALPLDAKILKSKQRIREWYYHFGGKVYVSFSGGKDSTVLLHLVRSIFPNVPAVYCDTGLEYPELKASVRNVENVEIIRPKKTFSQVITEYGYPIVSKEVAEAIHYARQILRGGGGRSGEEKERTSRQKNSCTAYHRRKNLLGLIRFNGTTRAGVKILESRFNKKKWLPLAEKAPFRISHYCCNVMKKQPLGTYHTQSGRVAYLGTLTEESMLRKQAWIRHGCNAFDRRKEISTPLAFWTEQDILEYIEINKLPIPSVYGDIVWVDKENQITIPETFGSKRATTGCKRTGCVFCAFGLHREKGDSRFQNLKRTHPKLYEYSIEGGQWIDNPDYVEGLSTDPDEMGWTEWNPKRIWVPDKKGLGMGFVFDEVNRIYGTEMMRYK